MAGGMDKISPSALNPQIAKQIYKSAPKGPVIFIDNFVDEIDQHGSEAGYKTICPPFDHFIMDYEYSDSPQGNHGCLLFEAHDASSFQSIVNRNNNHAEINAWWEKCRANAKTVLIIYGLAGVKSHPAIVPMASFAVAINHDGTNHPEAFTSILINAPGAMQLARETYSAICGSLAAMQVLGSGGLVAAVGDSLKQKLVRQAKKRMAPPTYGWRHHTIVVKPNEAKANENVYIDLNDEETMLPYHAVRAHYATYTKERPLFGKYVGRFYVPAHFRGKPENGFVTKDYKIIPHGIKSGALA